MHKIKCYEIKETILNHFQEFVCQQRDVIKIKIEKQTSGKNLTTYFTAEKVWKRFFSNF